jgi:hypothetical protein
VGRREEARRLVAELERGEGTSYTSALYLAMMYAALGDRERALDLLETDDREGDRILWLYYRGVFFDSIREDPRFIALVRRLGLPLEVRRGPSVAPH